MGYYVNPPTGSKENFLQRVGTLQTSPVAWDKIPEGYLPVILVDNGMFTAGAIGYSQREYEEFTSPRDTRRKKVYHVKIDDLVAIDAEFAAYWQRNAA